MESSVRQDVFISTRKSVPLLTMQQAEIFKSLDVSNYPAEVCRNLRYTDFSANAHMGLLVGQDEATTCLQVQLTPEQQTWIADTCAVCSSHGYRYIAPTCPDLKASVSQLPTCPGDDVDSGCFTVFCLER